ncbi:DUF4387 domain-containing protein [Microbispora sp. GKU 823]|uniref:DUF4387 domain-containing protein n=1 Tax=Microbispora sp. GKU 823 TaxID=1652100 RepID=UPI0009D2FFF1|nr:DUF4387 domain-containing protein [Microbispora sp. GKU 823]OPG09473.1 hypothetical protein B1L11_26065 [Microbispora sp. GKU 823]
MKTTQTIGDLASLVRSKNAGPFWLTIDVFCDSNSYPVLAREDVINAERVSRAYQIEPTEVDIYRVPDLEVIKVSFPRPTRQATPTDRDLHGGQQYVPLAQLPVEL